VRFKCGACGKSVEAIKNGTGEPCCPLCGNLIAPVGMTYVPHAGQLEFHESKARFRVLACGRRWGKSKCGAAEMVRRIIEAGPDSVAFVVAPTFTSTSLGRCWREFLRYCPKELIRDYPKGIHRTPGDRYIELLDRRMVYFKSADRPDTLAGEGLCAVWCDEPAQFHEDVWERVLPPALMERHGLAWFTGTPNGRNWYYRLFLEGQDPLNTEVESWNHSSYQNSVEEGGYIPKAEIDQIANRLPWQARQQEIMGTFLEDVNSVFRGVDACVEGEFSVPIASVNYAAGGDVAKHVDFTVIIIIDDTGHVVAYDRFGELEWPFQQKRIAEFVKRYRARLMVDSTGMGDPFYDGLRREDISVEGYKLTNASKAELIENLSMMIEQRKITLPGKPEVRDVEGKIIAPAVCLIPELVAELKAYGWVKSKGGNIIYGAQEGHDDTVIALAMAAWQMRLSTPIETDRMNVEW